jgi:hypothetical protein
MRGEYLMPVRLETFADGSSRNDTNAFASDRASEIDAHDELILSRRGPSREANVEVL